MDQLSGVAYYVQRCELIYGRVYLVTCTVNGKVYIGQTRSSVNYRWRNHVRQAISGCEYYFHNAIRKYGERNFTISIIQECYSEQELDDSEEYWIAQYQSFTDRTKGYNSTSGGVHPLFLEPLTEDQIWEAAQNWEKLTGAWPSRRTKGYIPELLGVTWGAVNDALRHGCRGLLKESSLPQFLASRGVSNRCSKEDFTEDQIWKSAESWYDRTGYWPSDRTKGAIPELPDDTWNSVNQALRHGFRGLPGESSLSQFLSYRGVVNRSSRLNLTENQVWEAAQAWYGRTGTWPSQHIKEEVPDLSGCTWNAINHALVKGFRGLPRGSSLSQFLTSRGASNRGSKENLTENQVWEAAQAWYNRTKGWPSQRTKGEIPELPGYTWVAINSALRVGGRGLAGGSFLPRLLASHGVINRCNR